MGVLIAGIIAAVVTGAVSMVDYLMDTDDEQDNIKDQQDYLDEKYINDTELLKLEFDQAKNDAEKNAERTEKQAELTDKQTTVTETELSDSFNNELDNIQSEQEKNTLDWNIYAISEGNNKGKKLTDIAASGVRAGSTMSDAIEMESAINSQQLQMTEDFTRQNQNLALQNNINSLNMGMFSIEGNRWQTDWAREDATYLRNSFAEGGDNWNIYQNKKKGLEDAYLFNKERLENAMDKVSGWNRFWGATGRLLSGGASGYSTGYNIATTFTDYYGSK